MKVEGIKSEDELRKAQAAAKAQGQTITDYNDWNQILKEFSENGIKSTGSYSGDKARMEEVKEAVAEYVKDLQKEEKVQQAQPQNDENQKIEETSKSDGEQKLKDTVANATSSQIMSDYMKYYHLLM